MRLWSVSEWVRLLLVQPCHGGYVPCSGRKRTSFPKKPNKQNHQELRTGITLRPMVPDIFQVLTNMFSAPPLHRPVAVPMTTSACMPSLASQWEGAPTVVSDLPLELIFLFHAGIIMSVSFGLNIGTVMYKNLFVCQFWRIISLYPMRETTMVIGIVFCDVRIIWWKNQEF